MNYIDPLCRRLDNRLRTTSKGTDESWAIYIRGPIDLEDRQDEEANCIV